ncbi:CxxH/CxxC protein [Clostridioides difficile]
MELIYACEEHVDEAMDEVINEKETFPVMNEVTGEKCSYCSKEAKYEIKII